MKEINLKEYLDRRDALLMGFLNITEPTSASKPRKKYQKRKKTMKDLLDSLSKTEEMIGYAKKENLTPLVWRLGAHVTWDDPARVTDQFSGNTLEFFESQGRPVVMFEALLPSDMDGENRVHYLMFAEKVNMLPSVEAPRANEHLYQFGMIHILYTDKHGKPFKKPIISTIAYHVAVSDTGSVRALKRCHCKYHTVFSKVRGRREGIWIPANSLWEYPTCYRRDELVPPKDRKRTIEENFCILYNAHARRELGTVITASKGDHRAVFSIPEHEWKRFFSDRIPVYIDGVKKNIFHWVAAHERNYKDKAVVIGTHTRGVRKFEWNGFTVNISLPKTHRGGFNDIPKAPMIFGQSKRKDLRGAMEITDDMADAVYKVSTK